MYCGKQIQVQNGEHMHLALATSLVYTILVHYRCMPYNSDVACFIMRRPVLKRVASCGLAAIWVGRTQFATTGTYFHTLLLQPSILDMQRK